MSLEKEIISYLETRPPVSIHELGEYITGKHTLNEITKAEPDTVETGKPKAKKRKKKDERIETGYSLRTIYGRLDKMEAASQIVKISPDDLKVYGIPWGDSRFKYVTLKTASDRKTHIDDVFSLLTSKNSINSRAALEEIQRYKEKYTFSPHQLDLLTNHLKKNFEGNEVIVSILYDYIIKRHIDPSNIDLVREKLRSLTKGAESNTDAQFRIRKNALSVLGFYQDEWVIHQLKEDTTIPEKFSSLKNDYLSKYTAKVIEAHRSDLFQFQNTLRATKRSNLADLISEIRNYANEHENDSLDYEDPMAAMHGRKHQ
jgi:hypothetical protein